MKTISENRAFGGVQGVYSHASTSTGCDMTFGLFLPEVAEDGPVPVIWYLSGLTCTHENANSAYESNIGINNKRTGNRKNF